MLLRLVKVDVGLRVDRFDELVTHSGVAVVLVAREPGTIRLASVVSLGGSLPAALSRVDSDDFLVFLEGDMTGKPRQCLKRGVEKWFNLILRSCLISAHAILERKTDGCTLKAD